MGKSVNPPVAIAKGVGDPQCYRVNVYPSQTLFKTT